MVVMGCVVARGGFGLEDLLDELGVNAREGEVWDSESSEVSWE